MPAFPSWRSPDVTTTATEAADIQLQLTTHLSTRKDKRLSWLSWLTYSGWLTHISGHPSATSRAQDSESTSKAHRPKTNAPPLDHCRPMSGHNSHRCRRLEHGDCPSWLSGLRTDLNQCVMLAMMHGTISWRNP